MPQVIITEDAVLGLERCRQFLAKKNPKAAHDAGLAIAKRFELLETDPEIGRSFDDHPELRELIIEFGETGYIALYQYHSGTNTVYILAFRHQKEAGY